MATAEGTAAYRARHGPSFGRTYFRRSGDRSVASIGVGTYLGDATDAVDDRYREAIVAALEGGSNVVDTAINYRHQRSERVVGEAVEAADVPREAVFVATKGGFVPFDGERPADPGGWIRERYLEDGPLQTDDLARGMHAIAPDFLDDQLDRSLANLGLETVDCYYVHNPETQLEAVDRETVYDRLEAAFTRLEERALAGDLRTYGVATWRALRVDPDDPAHLSLTEIVRRARAASRAAGAESTHFRAVQLPFNVHMADAFTVRAHEGPDGPQSALRFCRDAGLDVFTSASIGQGELAAGLPADVAAELAGETPVQRAINFARSAPGVTSALVGTSSPEHVAENLAAGESAPMGARTFDAVFE